MTHLPLNQTLPLNHLSDYHARDQRFSAKTLQLFADASLPVVLEVKAATSTTPAEILLYDEIGAFGITSKAFATALATAGEGDLTIRLNSPGGDVFDAMNIYNAIRNHRAPVTCIVDGLAASAASLIAMAGSTIKMQENSMMMIHNAHTIAIGDRHAMTSTADILTKVDGVLAQIYAERSKSTPEDAQAIMDKETWLTATEALASQYCDGVIANPPTKELSAKLTMQVNAGLMSVNEARASVDLDPVSDDDNDDENMQMSVARELRLRQLRLISVDH